MAPTAVKRLGWADLRRALRDVPALSLSFIYFFCLLCGYYVIRPVRDAFGASQDIEAIFPGWLINAAGRYGLTLDDLVLQILFSVVFIIMLIAQPLYGALVSRFRRRVFLPFVYGFFIVCLFGFYLLFDQNIPGRGAVFFIWMAVFNLFAVSVFWSFMSDIYSNDEARLLYGFIGVGGTAGAICGPFITVFFVNAIGVANLLLVSMGFLIICVICCIALGPMALKREREHGGTGTDSAIGGSFWAGLRIVLRDPLMRAFAFFMFFAIGVGTLLYNEQAEFSRTLVDDNVRTAYYASIDSWINGLTLLLQLTITPILLSRYGVGPLLLIPSFAILIGFSILSASPLPILVSVVQVFTRAGEFSLSKPARETIYTDVDKETRYKAKAFIDTAVYRGGDLSFVWIHKLLVGLGTSASFVVGIGVSALMTLSAWSLVKNYARRQKIDRNNSVK